MSTRDEARAAFQRDTRNHDLHIIHEGGPDNLVRYLRADRDGSSIYHFNIVTWPGYLSITGDMGSFTFARTRDMFNFFGEGRINEGYWSEKLQHPGGADAVAMEFDAEACSDHIRDDFRQWFADADRDARKAIIPIARELMARQFDSMEEALHGIDDETRYWDSAEHGDHPWCEFWDHRCMGYRYDFLWCCHAITWAVKRYRQIKTGRTQADVDRLILTGAA
jgi:hypothetical protein